VKAAQTELCNLHFSKIDYGNSGVQLDKTVEFDKILRKSHLNYISHI
jgi:hypothetical protein